jgi:hypothetical protein
VNHYRKKIRRGSRKGAVGLVHDVFQWLGLGYGSAEYALRRFRVDYERRGLPEVANEGEPLSEVHLQRLLARKLSQRASWCSAKDGEEPSDVAAAREEGPDPQGGSGVLQDVDQHPGKEEARGPATALHKDRTFGPVYPRRPRRVPRRCSSPLYV